MIRLDDKRRHRKTGAKIAQEHGIVGSAAPCAVTEKQFLQQVVDLAKLCSWRVYHPYLSVQSAAGFPDLVLARAGDCVLFVELKTATGRLTPAQEAWRAVLTAARGCEVYIWRPDDWAAIEARLLRQGGTR